MGWVVVSGESLRSQRNPGNETPYAESAGGARPAWRWGLFFPRAPPLFLFVCMQVSASRPAAARLSWCSRGVCRAGGGEETRSPHVSHKQQGTRGTLLDPCPLLSP